MVVCPPPISLRTVTCILGKGYVFVHTHVRVWEGVISEVYSLWSPPLTPNIVLKPPTGSVHATSVAASRVEQALSEVASSLQSSAPKQGPLHPWMTLAQIWLHAGTALT